MMKAIVVLLSLVAISHCQSDVQALKCCTRVSNIKQFGPGIAGKPVSVDLGRCSGSCTAGQSPVVVTDGTIDRFNGPEPASPSPSFVDSSILAGRPLIGFDTFRVDGWFAHTIRLPPNCRDLIRLTIKICLNATNSFLTITDSLFFYDPENDDVLFSRSLPTLFGSWPPGSSGCTTLSFSSSSPIGSDVFDYMHANGFLHLGVQDDTGVDYVQTTAFYQSGLRKICLPSLYAQAHVPLATGTEKVEKIAECDCRTQDLSRCRRQTKEVVYFQNSIFETRIDVGECAGSCSLFSFVPRVVDELQDVVINPPTNMTAARTAALKPQIIAFPQRDLVCQPIIKRRVEIRGPYGSECVEVIKRCRCQQKCFRMPYFKHVIEVVKTADGEAVEIRRAFNVGKCVGTCDQKSTDSGVMTLGDHDCPIKCSPRGYKYSRKFVTSDGTTTSVPLITSCNCKTV